MDLSGNILPRFLPVCVRAKFWDRLILPQILVVFKSPTTKIDLSIFSKSKRPFEKQTAPRLVTYLGLSMDKIWAKMIFDCGREISILLDFYRHSLLSGFELYSRWVPLKLYFTNELQKTLHRR